MMMILLERKISNMYLTGRQLDLYNIIKKFINKNGYSPSIRELCKLYGANSPATVHYQLQLLKRKKYIDYKDNMSRTIRIIKG